jgi:hypothetical protein
MNRFVVVGLIILIAAGCTGSRLSEQTWSLGYDFTKYAEKGFLITPQEYEGTYQSMGTIHVEHYPAGISVTASNVQAAPNLIRIGQYFYKVASAEDVIDVAYQDATSMGANALVRFDVDASIKTVEGVERPVLVVTGFAIKRTDM